MDNFPKMKFFVVLVLIFLVVCFVVCAAPEKGIAAESKVVNLKVVAHIPPTYRDAFYAKKRMVDYINHFGKVCNLSAEFYHSETVYKAKEILPSCMQGNIDIAVGVPPSYIEGSLPGLGITSLPGIWKDRYVHRSGTRRGTPYFNYVTRQYNRVGLLLLGATFFGSMEVLCNKPVKTLEDWKGIRVRTLGASDAKAFELINAVPVTITSAEIYTSLQRGIINAVLSTDLVFEGRRLYEVASYQINLGFFPLEMHCIINQAKFNSLTKEQQKVILNASELWAHDANTSEAVGMYMGIRHSLEKKYGVHQIYLSENELARLKKAMEPAVDWWKNRVGKEVADEATKAIHDSQDESLPKWGIIDLIVPE